MMEEDLIACLYPFESSSNAISVIRDPLNSPADCPRRINAKQQSPELRGRQSRETTAPPDDDDSEMVKPDDCDAGIELRFSHKLKGGLGIVIGTNRNTCDIVLPQIRNGKGQPLVSNRHCYITFDGQRRLIVQDCSTRGTVVTYDGKGRERRSNFKWIIGGHRFPDETEILVIDIHPELKFQIVVSKHRVDPDLFFNNVDKFLEEVSTNGELPLGALCIQSTVSTAAPSGRDTPSQRPILLKREKLGEGSFGVVHRVWDVSTGLEYASKKCRRPQAFDWRKEADIMRNTSHEHIVKLYSTLDVPSPQLLLEYLPLGNLERQHDLQPISDHDVSTLLRQGSSALSYLHHQTPPIVHRDIKPENILVSSRRPFHIKLSDFGLAKAGSYLETRCGTLIYTAPEIAQYCLPNSTGCPRYTCGVDIWSFGVVVFQYGYGLPEYGRNSPLSWCKQIVKEMRDWDFDSLLDVLLCMVVINPKRRYSAEECLERACELKGSQTPMPTLSDRKQREVGQSSLSIVGGEQDDHYFRNSKVQQYVRSQAPQCRDSPDFEDNIRQQDSLRSIQDSEIQGYIRSKISHYSGAPAFQDEEDSMTFARDAGSQVFIKSGSPLRSIAPTNVDKRKRSMATSSSCARRKKHTVTGSSLGHLNHEELGEQNNNLEWNAPALGTNAQDTEDAGYRRVAKPPVSYGTDNFVEHDSLDRSVGQGTANYGERLGTDSVLAACLLEEIHKGA